MDQKSLDKTYLLIYRVHFLGNLLAFILISIGFVCEKIIEGDLGQHLLKTAVYVVIGVPVCRVFFVGLKMFLIERHYLISSSLLFSFLFVLFSFF